MIPFNEASFVCFAVVPSVGVRTTKVYWPVVTTKAPLHSGTRLQDQKPGLFR